MSAQFDLIAQAFAQGFPKLELVPVHTVADEQLIRFVIYAGANEDTEQSEFDVFSVDRKAAASIVRKHRRAGSYVERRDPGEPNYKFGGGHCGHYFIEPRDAA